MVRIMATHYPVDLSIFLGNNPVWGVVSPLFPKDVETLHQLLSKNCVFGFLIRRILDPPDSESAG